MEGLNVPEWGWTDANPSHVMRHILLEIQRLAPPFGKGTRVLDVGCGNGYLANWFHEQGCEVVGVDTSAKGVTYARKAFPGPRFEVAPVSERLGESLGEEPFDIVVSTEVVEHLYSPWVWSRGAFNALRPGGKLIASTPYHGYLKNLLISLTGRWDRHMNALRDGGHIKMWSRASISRLLVETGFENIRIRGAGRLPYLWMSMVIAAERPSDAVEVHAQSKTPL